MKLSIENREFLTKCIDRLGRPNVDSKEHFIDASILPLLDITLRELFENYGTKSAFIDWVKAVREITSIHMKRLDIAVKEGDLVNRDLVKRGVIAPFENAHRKLLMDAPGTLVSRLIAMVKAERTPEECEQYARETLSKFLKSAKGAAKAGLRKI